VEEEEKERQQVIITIIQKIAKEKKIRSLHSLQGSIAMYLWSNKIRLKIATNSNIQTCCSFKEA